MIKGVIAWRYRVREEFHRNKGDSRSLGKALATENCEPDGFVLLKI
jgi:hypothetical protein